MRNILKITILSAFIAVLIAMAVATFFAQSFADEHFYSTAWFCGLWAVLAAGALVVFIKKLYRKLPVLLFHISLVIILLGALLTHLTSKEGMLHLRENESADYFVLKENMWKENLGFEMKLDSFLIKNYQ